MEQEHLKHGPDFNVGDLHLEKQHTNTTTLIFINKISNVEALGEIMSFGTPGLVLSMEEAFQLHNKKITKQTSSLEHQKINEAKSMVENYESLRPFFRTLKQMEIYSSYTNTVFGGASVIKMGNKLGLLKKKYLREGSRSLSLRTDDNRKLKYLVRIIGLKEDVQIGDPSKLVDPSQMNVIPSIIFDIVLGSMNIIKKGDVLVTPLAIYYE
ncbi:hypothetical protein ACT7DA_23260 [Bacillus pacificus]